MSDNVETTKTDTTSKCGDCLWLTMPCGKNTTPCNSLHEANGGDPITKDSEICKYFAQTSKQGKEAFKALLGYNKDVLVQIRTFAPTFAKSLDLKPGAPTLVVMTGDKVQFDITENDETIRVVGRVIGATKNSARVMNDEDGDIITVWRTNETLTVLDRGRAWKAKDEPEPTNDQTAAEPAVATS